MTLGYFAKDRPALSEEHREKIEPVNYLFPTYLGGFHVCNSYTQW
jgi:regulator of replication initiation timing